MKSYKIAILWRGDPAERAAATPQNNRYHRIFEEIEAHGMHAELILFAEEVIDEVEKQLMTVDGVLVWVNPIDDGLTRDKLDLMLRKVASKGPWVSAHPDESRLRESAQGDKWSFCLTAGKIGPRIRREHEQETAPEPCIGL